jgi:hypothetical protein
MDLNINRNVLMLILCFLTHLSVIGQKNYPTVLKVKDTSEFKMERTYFIHAIDSTKNYYILKTTTVKDTTVLVIKKRSKQLVKNLKTNQSFTFSTYKYGDFINPEYELCHYVEEKLVWCAQDYYEKNLDLHFTDDMGNETFEEISFEYDENLDIDSFKKKREYLIKSINTTERYYILETLFQQDTTVLVVAKHSEQLKGRPLQNGGVVSFCTYKIDDVYKPHKEMCHDVDSKIVWCFSDNIMIHFTDGMGNGFYENDKGW